MLTLVDMRNFLRATLAICFATSLQAKTWDGHPGPWGELIISSMYLEAPNSVLNVIPKPNSVTQWVFPASTPSGVKALFVKAGVPAALAETLTSSPRLVQNGNDVMIYPSRADILLLGGVARDAIYVELAKCERNEHFADPIFILSGNADEWLEKSGLNKAQKDFFRQVTWHRGEALVFSDIPALLDMAESKAEIDNTMRAITRHLTLLVSQRFPLVNITENSFLDYWFANQPETPRMTFIKAIAHETTINDSVDILHFLPVIMREKAYTFPNIKDGLKGRLPDCHWTSLNFFNLTPREYYRNTKLAAMQLNESYALVSAPYRFGDVICYAENGSAIHTTVYIADDIVLTKNGENILSPWVLLYLSDVSKIYKRSSATTIQGYRLKPSH